MKSKGERITDLDSELATLRENLGRAEAKVSAQGEELERLRGAIETVEEARAKLESEMVSLITAAAEASAAAVEHAKVKEGVIASFALFITLLIRPQLFYSLQLPMRLMRRPLQRFKNLPRSVPVSLRL